MQIDGHHTLTYIVARYAGIAHDLAEKVAYSAQYVDEATNDEPIHFDNGAMYDRIVSAHKMLDYRNTQELANHLVWIPFHFLPGNQGNPSDVTPEGRFIYRLICKPDSPVARDMLRMVATHWNKPYAAQLMGVAMHVYADTFAHQGFAGVIHDYNKVNNLKSPISSLLQRIKDDLLSDGISASSPLGHGAALSFPDRPYASWTYSNGDGETVERDNTKIFLQAANAMCKALQCWKSNDLNMNIENQPGLSLEQLENIEKALSAIDNEDGEIRHQEWIKCLREGKFGFAPVDLPFDKNGKNSWKELARGPGFMQGDKLVYQYSESFLNSDWKLFHDALKTYRLEVIRDVLPKYGICIA
ncbi:hypothetical protein Q4Q49_03565 [Shewanella sp. SP1S1-7]|uniref:DUF6765 family protein n=1 Tax=Shewanella TaxID=22 RepID=UPI002891BCBB|nr:MULTISPECIES: DUF6765 family protein [unclassified Shewanella]MDT3294773.1 hypothetical protein [Shewanella sp. SP2S2-6]MDT3307673.1 hypothetical protein [Shewanella sp. SP1S1-4]MDT3334362.1 hypothetical protein [Shewanella sp. SP1S1-7]